MRAILRNKLTKEILARKDYPRSDTNPVEGLDESLEWVFIEKESQPSFDLRTQDIQVTETETDSETPGVKKIVTSYTVVDKPIADVRVKLQEYITFKVQHRMAKITEQFVEAYLKGISRQILLTNLRDQILIILDKLDSINTRITSVDKSTLQKLQEDIEKE